MKANPTALVYVVLSLSSMLPVCPVAAQETASELPPRVRIDATTIYNTGTKITASGNVRFTNGSRRLSAGSGEYDTKTATGHLTDVYFTTCTSAKPDYHLEARELSIFGGRRIKARGTSLYLGNHRIVSIPLVVMNVGRRGASQLFPRPGVDKDDGVTLSQYLNLVDEDSLHVAADLTLTSRNGVQGELADLYGMDGTLQELPGRFLTYDSLRSSVLNMPEFAPDLERSREEAVLQPPARFRQFGRFTLKQRTYDTRNSGLVVYRQPEVGVSYVLPHIDVTNQQLAPELEMYPQITGAWGRFKEQPGTVGFTTRWNYGLVATANILPLGRFTAVQPVVAYNSAAYANNDAYRNWAFGVDASHLFSNGSIVTARYVSRGESGTSPFLFDTVDIFREFQGAFQVRLGRHVVGLVAGYNFDTQKVYDYELMYGYRTDCIQAAFTWHQLYQRLMFDVSILGM